MQRQGKGRPKDEAPRLERCGAARPLSTRAPVCERAGTELTYHGIQALALVALREVLYAELEGLRVQQQRGDVLEHDTRLRAAVHGVSGTAPARGAPRAVPTATAPWGSLAPP